jgi:hypothetical protein
LRSCELECRLLDAGFVSLYRCIGTAVRDCQFIQVNQTLIRLFLCVHGKIDITSVDDSSQAIPINKNRAEVFSSFAETPKVTGEKDAD